MSGEGKRIAVAVLAAALYACSGSGGGTSPPAGATYAVHLLVSDGAVPADHIDPNLKNPWGIAFNGLGPVAPFGPAWVADNGTDLSTLYDGQGRAEPLLPKVAIPAGSRGEASPTGIVYNPTFDFAMRTADLVPLPSMFIFDGEGGTLAAWTLTNLTRAVTVYDDGSGGAVYKGLALAPDGSGANRLYATDFHNNKIDVFDTNFAKLAPSAGAFQDPGLPAGFAPFGIAALEGRLYVTYAKQDDPLDAHDNLNGPGLGYVDIYDGDGHLLQRLASNGPLDAPWGLALAPPGFGRFGKALLIGNFGDGAINAYDPHNGEFLGSLAQADGTAIRFPGLWGLAFGNAVAGESQPADVLFFTAGINDEADGVYGRIEVAQ
jgi:uncharacterized protein (TIGR03118 family)